MPKVTVIMSVYNGEKFVGSAIKSILAQTFNDFEFIVINDGSTDKTSEILATFDDQRIKVIHQSNMGLTKSLNKGIQLARGEYIARMDSDDVALPERLEKQVKFMDANPDVGVVGTAYYEIDACGKIIGKKTFPICDKELKKVLIRYNPLFHGSVMIRRSVFEQVGLYNEQFQKSQDYELWFRVIKHFKLANLSEPLMMRRYTPTNISVAYERQQIALALKVRFKAIREGQYSWYYIFYMIRPTIVMYTPTIVKDYIRKYILKSKKW